MDGVNLSSHEANILNAVALLPQATRRSIATRANLGLAAVSDTLTGLLNRDLITRTVDTSGKGGRPSHVYAVRGALGHVVGVSLDPQLVRMVCLDAARERRLVREFPLAISQDSSRHIDEIVECVSSGIAELRQEEASPLLHVGVTLPGVTDADQGIWVQGFQVSGIRHVNLRDILERRLGAPVLVEDPARAAAFRELRHGHGAGARSFVLVYLDYGVGSGIVLGGELYRGRDGLSGEVGHLVVDPHGYRCSCGDVGCLETVASSAGILRCIRDRLVEGVVSSLVPEEVTLEGVLRAADTGDRLAQSALHEIGERIGTACSTLIKLLNPERLVIGGEGAMFARYFEPRIRMMLDRHVIPEMLAGLSLRFCEHSPDDEAHGAALMALEMHWHRLVSVDGGATLPSVSHSPGAKEEP